MAEHAATANPNELPKLLRDAAAGDGAAWERLVGLYAGRVFGLLVRQCGDRDLAEELTQATFVKVVGKLSVAAGYQERGRFEAWLFRIAGNNLRDEMRRRKRQAVPMDMGPGATSGAADASPWAAAESSITHDAGRVAPDAGTDPAEAVDRSEQLDLLRDAIAGLPEADRDILYLRHTAGLTFAQIAESLDQPLGTVLARGHRALKKLRAALEQRGVAAP